LFLNIRNGGYIFKMPISREEFDKIVVDEFNEEEELADVKKKIEDGEPDVW